MGTPHFASPMRPRRRMEAPDAARMEDLVARARTHDALAGNLAGKASRLDPTGSLPALRPLRWMVCEHRIKALLLRGQAACIGAGILPKAPD
jgi:hypothetical protein